MSRPGEEHELPDWLDQDWQDDILNAAADISEKRSYNRARGRLEPRDALLVLVVEQLHYIADELDSIRQVLRLSREAGK